MNSRRQTRIILIVLGSFAAFIAAITILWNNYLLPWQLPLHKDRKAIIEYVSEQHPNSKIAEEHIQYRASGYFIIFELKPDCYITFEENGFQYRVFASHGKVYNDIYSKMKLRYEVSAFINDEFLRPRGIKNVDFYSTFDLDDDELPSEWSEYNDAFWVTISVRGQGTTPQEVGWLWDCYKFWRDNQPFNPNWNLTFDIYYDTNPNACWDSSISIHNTEKFGSKAEWYAENTYIPNPGPIH